MRQSVDDTGSDSTLWWAMACIIIVAAFPVALILGMKTRERWAAWRARRRHRRRR
jgi:hypothetical protein